MVGLGTVGRDIAQRLLREGRQVNVYDKDGAVQGLLPEARWRRTLRDLFESSRCILGCTGEDLLRNPDWLGDLRGDRILASCSSEDIEFRSLLRRFSGANRDDPLGPIELPLRHGTLTVLRGGFPANFTGTKNSGPVSLIQVTRALLLAGVFQAAGLAVGPLRELPKRIMLDPELQAAVARAFVTPRRRRLFGPSATSVQGADWAAAHSTGERVVPKGHDG